MGDLISSFKTTAKKIIGHAFAARPIPFKAMFDRFRQVLEYHNRAIEIIADMGEKLGGDYIFDITYIRAATPYCMIRSQSLSQTSTHSPGINIPGSKMHYASLIRKSGCMFTMSTPREENWCCLIEGLQGTWCMKWAEKMQIWLN